MYRHENPDLFDAKERFYQAEAELGQTLEQLRLTIARLEDRIVELTEARIEVHKWEEDKP